MPKATTPARATHEYLVTGDDVIHSVPRPDGTLAICGATGPFYVFFGIGRKTTCPDCGGRPSDALAEAASKIGRVTGEPDLAPSDVQRRLSAGWAFESMPVK